MELINQIVLALVPGIIIAALTSYITVRLSLKRYYSERWWERKAEAYSTIIKSFYQMKAYPMRMMRASEKSKEISRERYDELKLHAQKGFEEITRAIAIGTFIISDEAVNSLNQFQDEYHNIDEKKLLSQVMEDDIALVDKYIKIVRECAKKDLRIQ